jgi:hypothetical protein
VSDHGDEVGLDLMGLRLGGHVIEHENATERAPGGGSHLPNGGVVHAGRAPAECDLQLPREVGARPEHGFERGVAEAPRDGVTDLEGTGELEELGRGPVDHHEPGVVVDDDDRVRHPVHDSRQLLLLVADPLVDICGAQGERCVVPECSERPAEGGVGWLTEQQDEMAEGAPVRA